MKKKLSKFKEFYSKKGGKYILFFGFYIVFFAILAIVLKNSKPVILSSDKKEVITSLRTLFEKDFSYQFEVNDDGQLLNFVGKKGQIDYENYDYKYFLDYINLNQLLKKSKLIESNQYEKKYELANSELNSLLKTEKEAGINIIVETDGSSLQDSKNTLRIVMNLSSYIGKNYTITLNYKVGEA